MKNLLIALLVIATLALGGMFAYKTHQARTAQTASDALAHQVDALQTSVDEQEKKAARLREQVEQARADTAAKSAEAAQARASLGQKSGNHGSESTDDSSAAAAKQSNPLSELFSNPDMKEMIKNQQKTVLQAMIDKNYAKLFSDLHLTPEQASQFKDLLLNKQLSAADVGMSMMSGDLDAAKREELTRQVKATTDASDAQIKQFLGDDNYGKFQDYEKTMAERMSVSGFKDQLGSGATALSDSQEQQLIEAMNEERTKFKFTTDLSDKSKLNGDFASMLSSEKMDGYLQELGQLNQQYLNRAQTVLSPDQYSAFEKYMNNQQAMQKMGLQMAAKMFGPTKSGGK